ncbi:Baeyer-Villiger monooxygenase [Lasiodiplodia hormozganensis]|uniref:Baeyer-Villiger monooxygenase n=1 Tax=Lasiodiplodia hormozganensis TaxID=869390 RepID=A0AA40D5P6_9PEZI|nr:Baeyer-Villiger monooxygenase [Lasiodiplodia hormozganensis]
MSLDTDVLIIGGGPSGLGMAIQLIRKFGTRNFTIIEKSDNIGGTWWANSYPGCGCDVPSHFYSLSFALNPNWSRAFALQPEIHQYFSDLADSYQLRSHTRLQTTVERAIWDKTTGTWLVTLRAQQSKTTTTLRCKILISAVGSLSVPNDCDILGAEEFQGRIFHSAQWDHTFDYKDKDVVVVGNGCSATQFVPIMSDPANPTGAVRKLTQFSRQPHWLAERPNPEYGETFKWAMRWIPGVMRAYRWYIFTTKEYGFASFPIESGRKQREIDTAVQSDYIRKNAPPELRDFLVPKSVLGCKRKVQDTNYLACLHRDNVELVHSDPIARITPTGVETKLGRTISADAIVLANGFKTHQPLFPMEIRGASGESLEEHWKRYNEGSPEAYFGTMLSGFPNFFVLMGPNTVSGHLSVLYTTECQINFVNKLIAPILAALHPKAVSLRSLLALPPPDDIVEVKPEAEAKDVEWVAQATKKLVWSTGCSSWGIDERTGKNTMMYPDWQFKYWLRSLWPKWGDMRYEKSKPALAAESRRKIWPRYVTLLVVAAIIGGGKAVETGSTKQALSALERSLGSGVGFVRGLL